jgi:predicted transcriptional regulator
MGTPLFTVRLPAKHRKEVERLAQQNNLLPSIWARRALMEPGALELWNQSSPTSLVA